MARYYKKEYCNYDSKAKRVKARVARNPRTNEQIKIGEKLAVNWKMGKTLFNRLNKI